MAKKLFTTSYITNIANSIRTKLGVTTQYKVSEMAAAIASIPGGGQPTLYTPTIELNGDYLNIIPNEANGDFNTNSTFYIYNDDTLLTTTTETQILLYSIISTQGTYRLHIVQKQTNFTDSEVSNVVVWQYWDGLALTAENGDVDVMINIHGTLTNNINVYYKNGENWIQWFNANTGNSNAITIPNGSTFYLWNENSNWGQDANNYVGFTMVSDNNGQISFTGPINALVGGTAATNEYCFYRTFMGCTPIISARNMTLPTLSVALGGYASMFENCTGMVSAPDLPATTLGNYAYDRMFAGCTALSTAPSTLPTYGTLAEACYKQMFYGCERLATAPKRIGTLMHGVNIGVQSCYQMFYGCTSLLTPPVFSAGAIYENGCKEMFSGCSTLTISLRLYAYTLGEFTFTPIKSRVREGGLTNMLLGCSFVESPTWKETGTPDYGISLYYNPAQ